MAATSASPWSSCWSSAAVPRVAVRDGERADDLVLGATERRRGHRPQAHAHGHLPVLGRLGDALVGQVVRRPEHPSFGGSETVDAAAQRELHGRQPLPGRRVGAAGQHGGRQELAVLGEQGEVRVIGVQQAA